MIFLCPACHKGDDKAKRSEVNWVECDKCNEWYHTNCVPPFDSKIDFWECQNCTSSVINSVSKV